MIPASSPSYPFTRLQFAGYCTAIAMLLSLSACKPAPQTATVAGKVSHRAQYDQIHPVPVAAMTALGRGLFFDKTLSASGQLSCASCHDPAHAYGPPNDLAVQAGGSTMQEAGLRAVPSLRYLQKLPPFSEHFHDEDVDESVDQGPTGGHTWDGRAQSAHDQARLPLLSAQEMANENAAAVVARVKASAYAEQFRSLFGNDVFDHPDTAFEHILMALEIFQQDPAEFYPYTSKYDAFLHHQTTLSPQEARGLALFNNPVKGNCASCHPATIKSNGSFPQFTDHGYIALGVPRNAAIPANADANYFDLGLCGPLRTDLRDQARYCGLFKTPTLRNAGLRRVFFHNGSLHQLDQVLRFYVERDARPELWYPRANNGRVNRFDDLPEAYHANVNSDSPFGGKPGSRVRLNASERQDVIAFLQTLTDGYTAKKN